MRPLGHWAQSTNRFSWSPASFTSFLSLSGTVRWLPQLVLRAGLYMWRALNIARCLIQIQGLQNHPSSLALRTPQVAWRRARVRWTLSCWKFLGDDEEKRKCLLQLHAFIDRKIRSRDVFTTGAGGDLRTYSLLSKEGRQCQDRRLAFHASHRRTRTPENGERRPNA